MADDDFKRGEAKAHLENLISQVGEIKVEMKDHNESDKEEFNKINTKIDAAADLAAIAVQEVNNEKKANRGRHQENKEYNKSIKKTVEAIAKKQQETDGKVAKIYTVAAVIGGGAGLLLPWIKDYFDKFTS